MKLLVAVLVLALSAACSTPAGQRVDEHAGADGSVQLEVAPPREPATNAALGPEREFGRAKFGGVRLTDQHGREVDVFDELVRGKLVLVNFIYTQCQGRCPRATANLLDVRALLPGVLGEERARDVVFLSFSLDPKHDTPEAFDEYARGYGIDGAWSFLSGPEPALEALRKRLGFYDLDPVIDADRTQHANFVLIGNEPRARWLHVPLNVTPEQIADAVRRVAR